MSCSHAISAGPHGHEISNYGFLVKRATSLTILVLVVFSAALIGSPAHGQEVPGERTVEVLIAFKHQPRASDLAWLNGRRAVVKRQFNVVPVVSATIPESMVASLRSNPAVAYVEDNGIVRASEDTLDWGVDRIDAEIVWGGAEDSVDVGLGLNAGAGIDVAVLDTPREEQVAPPLTQPAPSKTLLGLPRDQLSAYAFFRLTLLQRHGHHVGRGGLELVDRR